MSQFILLAIISIVSSEAVMSFPQGALSKPTCAPSLREALALAG